MSNSPDREDGHRSFNVNKSNCKNRWLQDGHRVSDLAMRTGRGRIVKFISCWFTFLGPKSPHSLTNIVSGLLIGRID